MHVKHGAVVWSDGFGPEGRLDLRLFTGEDALRETLQRIPPLRKDAAAPLWVQLRNVLADAIASPVVEPDTRLPSESALCHMFGVSRPIVRLALDSLAASQLVVKVPRQGAFVASRKRDADFASLNTGLFGEMISKGHKVETEIVAMNRSAPTETERARLWLPARSDVFRVRRIYSLDGVPTALTLLVLAGHRVKGIERHVVNNRSVYRVMREHYGLEVSRSERWFEATMATPEQAHRLAMPHPSPGLSICSIGLTEDNVPIEYYDTFYNTARTRIHVTAWSRASGETPDACSGPSRPISGRTSRKERR